MRMDELGPADIVLFGCFRFDRRTGGLFRLDETSGAKQGVIGASALALRAQLTDSRGEMITKDEILPALRPARVG